MRQQPFLTQWRGSSTLVRGAFAVISLAISTAFAQPVTKEALLENLAKQVIPTHYRDLADKSALLTRAAGRFATNRTPETLEHTRQAWRAVMLSAREIQWLQIGPVADRECLALLYYSKVMPLRIEEAVQAHREGTGPSPDDMSPAARGLFAMEYLLFDPPPASAASPAPAARLLADDDARPRSQLLLALARYLQRQTAAIASDWAATNRQSAPALYTAGGQQTINTLVNQLPQTLEKIAEGHLNLALQLPAPVMQQWDRIEGARSRSSLAQLRAMVEGVRQAYRGTDGPGLDDYLRTLNPDLEARIAQQFSKSLAALELIDKPLEVAVTDTPETVRAAYQAVRDLEILFKVDAASALGVTITFDSGDGD